MVAAETPEAPARRLESGGEPTKPSDLSHHFNRVTRERTASSIKSLYKYFQVPGMMNLAGGLPFPGYFPYDTLESAVSTSGRFPPNLIEQLNKPPSKDSGAPGTSSSHLIVPKFKPGGLPGASIDVATTLQYGQASGFAPLAEFVKDFSINHLHGGRIPYEDPEILLTCGNTDGLGKVMQMIAERGDNMLVEEYTYPNAIQTADPYGVSTAPVKVDAEGMLAEGKGGLRDVLENWDHRKFGRRPRFMYTVTIGQNPTGANLSLQRRKEIYHLCERYDVIIIEDDPYWYLQFTKSSRPKGAQTLPTNSTKKRYPFLEALIPSYLTIDTSGRVIRLDTFSKAIAPGCRMGWITAQPAFIERLTRITESSTQSPSGFAQAMVVQLLRNIWGMDGWVGWLEGLRAAYEARMRAMCRVLDAYKESTVVLESKDEDSVIVDKTKMYSFDEPMGGMFVWVHIHIASHPAYSAYLARGHTKRAMMNQLWKYGAEEHICLPCPGWIFGANKGIREDSSAEFFRLCFAAIEAEKIEEATERFGRGIREFWGFSVDEIENCCSADGVAEAQGKEAVWNMGYGGFGC
ncbi:PLP-dependent transferase [Tuber magnatum]|uniref:PLP-dependent transferase n=1 Tax=Tuber magnatum TaxID=42249 RepID=A0A317SDD3_9PEZI|nr:PLP-dependent transferase [Tuber magnatum]